MTKNIMYFWLCAVCCVFSPCDVKELRNCKGILEEYVQTYGVLRVRATYTFWHVETYQKGELKREFLKKGIPFWGGIQKEEGGAIFL